MENEQRGQDLIQEPQQQERNDNGARTFSVLCHLGALSMYLGVPFGNILVPLILWLIKKDELPEVNEHGKSSLNFQISFTIYILLAAVAFIVLVMTTFVLRGGSVVPGPAILLAPLLIIFFILFHVIVTIVGAVKAGEGKVYNYPLTIKFLR